MHMTEFLSNTCGIPHGYGRFDDNRSMRINFNDFGNTILNTSGIKIVSFWIVVSWGRDKYIDCTN
ncbi:hypothetical protein GCM10011607_19640 [Shewanella inventionis]|uniref:DUF3289 family protein n=1 Tax=Shewanella inventionis TaxID=1738770 RepID=A0ABQ1J3E6_9GAMM|nr:hypothetical protein GCM10011607_19640 [Shewanella inventionis]